jgi:hypothetical protein
MSGLIDEQDESLDPINDAVVYGTVLQICPDLRTARSLAPSDRALARPIRILEGVSVATRRAMFLV